MSPVEPGSLLQLVTADYMPPKMAPSPVLDDKDVAEAPLPPVLSRAPPPAAGGGSTAAPPPPRNGQPKLGGGTGFFLLNLAMLLIALLPF